jgi:enamine deaminase RidA (YjgF/YER057c/UK114 family)
MIAQYLDTGIASRIGCYSDAVVAGPNLAWLLTSATPGLSVTGALPADFEGQTMLAWEHIIQMLEEADMTVADIIKVNQ